MKYPALQTRSSWAPCRWLYSSLVGSQELFQGDPSIGRARLASAGVGALADFCLLQFLQNVISDVYRRCRDAEIILGPAFRDLACYSAGTLDSASMVKGRARDSRQRRRQRAAGQKFLVLLRKG